jgi:hypothetical protein
MDDMTAIGFRATIGLAAGSAHVLAIEAAKAPETRRRRIAAAVAQLRGARRS